MFPDMTAMSVGDANLTNSHVARYGRALLLPSIAHVLAVFSGLPLPARRSRGLTSCSARAWSGLPHLQHRHVPVGQTSFH